MARRDRRKAYQDGVLEADGGVCNRHRYVHDSDLLAAYNRGKADHTAHLKEQADRVDHPLQTINNQADALASRSDNEEVREIADMIRDLTQYLIEKESN